jgi:hypothetical protein
MMHPEVAKREQDGDHDHGIKEVTEGEECRKCLDQGYLRRCCNEFYCHRCYLQSGFCPGCNVSIATRHEVEKTIDPGIELVLATWVASALMIIVPLIVTGVMLLSEATLPITIWGEKCYGFFPKCDITVCVDLVGSASEGIQNLANYPFCEIETTVNRIRGKACVYDEELYRQSETTMGFDFCYDAVNEPENNFIPG